MTYNTAVIIFPLLVCIFGILPALASFGPLTIPSLVSKQCAESSRDISGLLKSVAEMLSSSNSAEVSYPLSCLEVKESSPGSPSGYYTLSNGTGNTNIVYCNMDELYSCPSLEQALKRIQSSLDQNTIAITVQLESSQEISSTFSTAINDTMKGIQSSLDQNTNAIAVQLESSQELSSTFSTAINDTVNDVLHLTQKLITLHLPASCQEVLDKEPSLSSGTYTLSNKLFPNEFVAYCHFEDLCNTPGPWTRMAFLNMSDTTQNCSSPFELYESNGVRACGRPHPLTGGCQSVTFPVNQTLYSQVCGQISGYQYHSPDGFNGGSIDQAYVDGISLTHGCPRQHIWSFAASKDISGTSSCPCAGGNSPPAFVGNDYFCESGSNGGSVNQQMYTSDPLWDGQGCVGGEPVACCQATSIPWFHKVLNTSTTNFIELRMCGYTDEDSPFSLYEIYVKYF